MNESKSPRVEILIVTHGKDAVWLPFCFESIARFCSGFGGITVVGPTRDSTTLQPLVAEAKRNLGLNIEYTAFDEAEGKGHLHHMIIKCKADIYCPHADLIMHVDSDCIFYRPCTPDSFFKDGKPIVIMAPYSYYKERHPSHYNWKFTAEAALRQPVEFSCMERHPSLYHRSLYGAVRDRVEAVHEGMSFDEYVLSTRPGWPYGFCEFVTLGGFALSSDQFKDQLFFWNKIETLAPENYLIQFWSHRGVDVPHVTPAEFPAHLVTNDDGTPAISPTGTIVPRVVMNRILGKQ